MAKAPAFASGMRGQDKPKYRGELERICVEGAENGFVLICEYRPPKRKPSKGEIACGYEPSRPVRHLANTEEEAGEMLTKLLKGDAGDIEGESEDEDGDEEDEDEE